LNSLHSIKKEWILTQEAFDRLLACLDGDRPSAARKYEIIRKGLITFFECRGCALPADYADQTFDRVARRLTEGVDIHTTNPSNFFFGVAKRVLREYWDKAPKDPVSLDALSISEGPLTSQSTTALNFYWLTTEPEVECQDQCMAELSAESQALILGYYDGDGHEKCQNRKIIAQELGISPNSLRIRALRIRERLESCVSRCAKGRPSR
jgi:DNA-directed RNA polymerase specialized sigma24 family protein